jgi:endonuclease/exonuclease/phosphatase family metal-dependent hydrolase
VYGRRGAARSAPAAGSTAPGRRPRGSASATFARILVLSWNLFHGRAKPAAGRPLAAEFAVAIAGWNWDVALLQEVPPWWPSPLAAAAGADFRMALTSRNSCLPVRRAIAARNPDLIAANGGGCNAILVRGGSIGEHRTRELTKQPERRVMHGITLAGAGWVVNLHGSTHPREQRRADLLYAAATALEWAAGAPLIFGGDLNSTQPAMPGLRHVAGHHVDHFFTEGRPAASEPELLDAGPLSDHEPLRVAV